MSIIVFAQQLCVITNQGSTGEECSQTQFGIKAPCTQIPFVVKYTVPSGYAIGGLLEWFVNGTLSYQGLKKRNGEQFTEKI